MFSIRMTIALIVGLVALCSVSYLLYLVVKALRIYIRNNQNK